MVATWNEYLQAIADPAANKTKSYYYDGQLRIEMVPVGPDHARDNSTILLLITLLGMVKGIKIRLFINCSYRNTGPQEAQPEASFYLNQPDELIPRGGSVVNLDDYPPPDLAIEISDTSLADDKGEKRLLYEELGVAEYWVVDVKRTQIKAFRQLEEGGSQRIMQSVVLPGLPITLLEEALGRSRQQDSASLGTWFMAQIQA